MSCRDTQSLIHGYLDGELDLVRSMEIEGHLQECQICSQVYENHQALRSAISKGSLYWKPPERLKQRIHNALREAGKVEARPRVTAAWRPAWTWMRIAASVAFVALITWSLVTILPRPSADELLTREVVSSHVRSLMANHLTDVPSSDQHTVKPWFNGKLDFSPPVEDLTQQGFPLKGGRLDYLGNRPVAALVYQRRQHFINLFIWPSTRASDAARKTVTRQGYHVFHWTQSGMIYWAVSDLNNSELQEFVQLYETKPR